jgi:hypothetical protein
MLLLQNAGRECFLCIPLQDFHGPLEQYGSCIHSLICKMHCAAGYLDPIFQSLFLRVKPRKRGKQSRMDV